ncbi:MAG: ribosomal RNA small subunit methyltransferase A, partial [Acidobacteriaceae bacterium]|nr:ribosomal RNA small subunit methyltransferase A [Acidobacteriaceae bacterium]
LDVREADILKVDLSQFGQFTITGNLPYYITSPIVEKTLALYPAMQRAVFLVQKEVAVRLTSGPGSRDYGYLSVATQLFANVEMLFTISPGAFKPPPKVDSAVVSLTPKPAPPGVDTKAFLRFIGRCFLQKRKTLRNNLRGSYDPTRLDAHPYASKRAEELSIDQLLELYAVLA